MPKRKQVKSLKECCLKRIALSLESYWLEDFDQTFKDLPRLLYVIGPFENLTNETIQEIINSLADQKCLRRHHFPCLLQDTVTRLDLSGIAAANGDLVVQSIISRCPKLISLSLKGLSGISVSVLAELVKEVGSLRTLSLMGTSCNDQILSLLAHNNQSITDLDVSSTKVTDSGAFSLCQHWDEEGNVGCRKLIRLGINGTLIKITGALHLLRNLPKLQYLNFLDVCTLVEMDAKQQENGIIPKHIVDLRLLTANQLQVARMSQDCIPLSCALCPNTLEADFFYGINDDNISALSSLKQLQRLGLGNSDGTSLTFEKGLLPVFSEIGNQLTELTLADINDFDIIAIGQCCRNLRCLSVLISDQTDHVVPYRALVTTDRLLLFRKLRELYVVYPISELHSQVSGFKMLLSNAKDLCKVSINYMKAFTTDMLLNVFQDNPMLELTSLRLESCDNIGPEPIESLVKGDNQLKQLELYACKEISLQDCERLQKHARKEQFDIEIKWK